MNKLDKIKIYAEALSKAAKWKYSNEAIANIDTIKKSNKKKEYIYEFYCLMRLIDDLFQLYKIEIVNPNKKVVFPKSPASKRNYPFFKIKDKTNVEIFQVCVGINIIGHLDETKAPDISFQYPSSSLTPTYEDVFMICDAKFKHKLNGKVTDGEFAKICIMIDHLKCENAELDAKTIVKFKNLVGIYGNCLFSNGQAYKADNLKLHIHHHIKEVEKFDEGTNYVVIG